MGRKYSYAEIQVKKNMMNIETGIEFMKKSFLTIKIEGAKLIEVACKQAIQNHGFTNSPNKAIYLKNYEDCIQILKD